MRLFHTKNRGEIFGEDIILDYSDLQSCKSLQSFTCGNDSIDNIIKEKLIDDTMTKSFAVSDKESTDIIAVYSLSCSGFIVQSYQKVFIYPAVEIQYFAIHEKYQDIQYCPDTSYGCLSNILFDRIIAEIYDFTDKYCGADKIILYSVPTAHDFYIKSGFQDFEEYMLKSQDRFLDGCIPMFFNM